jgi:hypothetical protein
MVKPSETRRQPKRQAGANAPARLSCDCLASVLAAPQLPYPPGLIVFYPEHAHRLPTAWQGPRFTNAKFIGRAGELFAFRQKRASIVREGDFAPERLRTDVFTAAGIKQARTLFCASPAAKLAGTIGDAPKLETFIDARVLTHWVSTSFLWKNKNRGKPVTLQSDKTFPRFYFRLM